ADFQHGFSLQPMNMNFQVVPGYDHVLTIKPQAPGTYPIVCNEFCGIGHQNMVGKIIVDEGDKPTSNTPTGKRICATTGLPICLDAQFFVKCNAVLGVVFLLIGGI